VATTAQRNHMGAFMDYLVHKTAQIHYRQYRPMDLPTWPEAHLRAVLDNGGDVWADCSEGSYTVWHAGGLHPPGGSWEYGNTDTVYEHLPHYHDARRALIGAAVVWGEFPGTHHMAWSATRTRSTATRCCGRSARNPTRGSSRSSTRPGRSAAGRTRSAPSRSSERRPSVQTPDFTPPAIAAFVMLVITNLIVLLGVDINDTKKAAIAALVNADVVIVGFLVHDANGSATAAPRSPPRASSTTASTQAGRR
jgi:hypothetical protein